MPDADLLRSLHVPGKPIVLPNAWDAASAKVIEAAGFPALATTSGGVAAALGYEDHEGAPAEDMLAAAGRICGSVEIPVTVDFEAGYGMEPAELAAALIGAGASGCNLEDTDNATDTMRDPAEHAEWLRRVREAAGDEPRHQRPRRHLHRPVQGRDPRRPPGRAGRRCAEAGQRLRRGRRRLRLSDPALGSRAAARLPRRGPGPVNVLGLPSAPSIDELAEIGVARVTYGSSLQVQTMQAFGGLLESLRR